MNNLQFIEFDDVHRLSPWPGLIEAMAQAHQRPRALATQCRLTQPREGGQADMLVLVPAWEKDRALGVKIVTSFPENTVRHGLATVGSLYILFDAATGKPRTIIDGEALICRKTAADTALGVRQLAPPGAQRMLLFGAGALAPYVVEAVRAVRPGLREIRIWNRSRDKAAALAEHLRDASVSVTVCDDPEADQAWADIVIAATMASTPLVHGARLKPGAHVGLIGSFTPEMREGDDELLRRARIYVDDWAVLDCSGEFLEPLAAGVIERADIRGDLFDVCGLEPPDTGAQPITLFKNGGASHLDLITASHIVSNVV